MGMAHGLSFRPGLHSQVVFASAGAAVASAVIARARAGRVRRRRIAATVPPANVNGGSEEGATGRGGVHFAGNRADLAAASCEPHAYDAFRSTPADRAANSCETQLPTGPTPSMPPLTFAGALHRRRRAQSTFAGAATGDGERR